MMKKIHKIFIDLVACFIFAASFFTATFLYLSLRKLSFENLPPKILYFLGWEKILHVSVIVAIGATIVTLIIMIIKKDNKE
jgi:hypothetical protein